MKAIKSGCWITARMLLSAVVMLLLAGCAMHGSTRQPCVVLDPDLAHGTYVGGCKEGMADGYGEVSGAGSYRGDFRAGMKHGKGIKAMPNGDRYAGEFSEDYRHGKGVYVWSTKGPWSGDRYEGEYRRDLRHGWGVFQWGSGDRYEGPWQGDLRMGASAMELRRTQAGEAAGKSIKPGVLVCAEVRLGLASHQRISGRIEQAGGDAVRIRVVAVEGGVASYHGAMVKVGDMLTVGADSSAREGRMNSPLLSEWQPCEK